MMVLLYIFVLPSPRMFSISDSLRVLFNICVLTRYCIFTFDLQVTSPMRMVVACIR